MGEQTDGSAAVPAALEGGQDARPPIKAGETPALPIHAVLFCIAAMKPDDKIALERFARKILRGSEDYQPGAMVKDDLAVETKIGCWYQEVHLPGGVHEMVSLNNDLQLPPFYSLFAFDREVPGPGGRAVKLGALRADIEDLAVNAPRRAKPGEAKDPATGLSPGFETIRLPDEAVRRYRAAFAGSAAVPAALDAAAEAQNSPAKAPRGHAIKPETAAADKVAGDGSAAVPAALEGGQDARPPIQP